MREAVVLVILFAWFGAAAAAPASPHHKHEYFLGEDCDSLDSQRAALRCLASVERERGLLDAHRGKTFRRLIGELADELGRGSRNAEASDTLYDRLLAGDQRRAAALVDKLLRKRDAKFKDYCDRFVHGRAALLAGLLEDAAAKLEEPELVSGLAASSEPLMQVMAVYELCRLVTGHQHHG